MREGELILAVTIMQYVSNRLKKPIKRSSASGSMTKTSHTVEGFERCCDSDESSETSARILHSTP